MSTILFANLGKSTLAGGITNVATTVNLAVGTGVLFPAPGAGQYFVATFTDALTGLLNEIVHVTNITGDVATIVRAQESTTALAWLAGDLFDNLCTAGTMQSLFGSLIPGTGAQLQYVSTTSLLLAPAAGGQLWINGINYAVPASCNLASSAFSATTLGYVYAYMSGSTMTLEASATGYTLASNGIPQKTGDATRTLVGMAYPDGSTHFNDSVTKRNVASYFNRTNKSVQGPTTGVTTITSGAFIEINTAARVEALTWLTDAVTPILFGAAIFSTIADVAIAVVGIDGSGIGYGESSQVTATVTQIGVGANYSANLADGHHLFSPFGASNGGNTVGFNVGLNFDVRN
jgi:hypothetical protein